MMTFYLWSFSLILAENANNSDKNKNYISGEELRLILNLKNVRENLHKREIACSENEKYLKELKQKIAMLISEFEDMELDNSDSNSKLNTKLKSIYEDMSASILLAQLKNMSDEEMQNVLNALSSEKITELIQFAADKEEYKDLRKKILLMCSNT